MAVGFLEVATLDGGEARRELCATSWSLQGMRLPGLPKHWSNIVRKGHMAAWPRHPHPLRRGAYVYPVTCLPQATLDAMREQGMIDGELVSRTEPAEIHAPAPLAGERLDDDPAPPVPAKLRKRSRTCAIDRDEAVRDLILQMLATYPHVAAPRLAEAIQVKLGKEIGVRSLQRWLKSWKEKNKSLHMAMVNPDRDKGRNMPAMGSASEGIERPHQVWEMDATPTDVMLEGGRHSLIGCLDVWSRRGKLLVVETSKAVLVATLMRHCMIDWGAVPEIARHDQGKEFKSRHMERVCADLGIEQDLCPPFTPQAKPHIERFFRTFAHDLVELLPGYVGHNVAERQAIRERESFATRFGKRQSKTDNRATRAPIDLGHMTAEEMQQFCDDWCLAYEGRRHSALGMSPRLKAGSYRGAVRRLESERVLDVLLAETPGSTGYRNVQKKGIRVEGTWFIAPELGALVGERVSIRLDPADAGRVWVFRDDREDFLCVAEAPERTGCDRREIQKQAQAQYRERRKIIAEYRRKSKKAGLAHIGAEILAGRVQTAEKIAHLPTRGTKYGTAATRAAEIAIDADTGLPVQRMSPELEAFADQAISNLEAERASRERPRELMFDGSGRPINATDEEFYRWVDAHPEQATAADRAYVAELLEEKMFRLLVGVEQPKKKAAGS